MEATRLENSALCVVNDSCDFLQISMAFDKGLLNSAE